MVLGEAGELVHRCGVSNDDELWQEFVDRFGGRLMLGVVRAMRRYGARLSRDDREDLVQDVYCRLLQKRSRGLRSCRGKGEQQVAAYLARVAESVVVDKLRADAAAKRGRTLLIERIGERDAERSLRVAIADHSPEERLLAQERRRRFLVHCRAAVGRRKRERNLQILYLALLEGCSSKEICHRLGEGLTPTGVDSMMHRLRKKLADRGLRVPRR
jgi:RNA polymerase sigma factor (sigma-70 family)